ncbi:GGDEF domain-containing protein [Nakamurella deserti]|uniref:GGDEF domain-containing protein n=1 Tax=Nakamurella deserti TaxID=2164074 RepID=UPI0013004B20|nr:sensor domain-containing diguanylate cyclase [Nakamurella deserti]
MAEPEVPGIAAGRHGPASTFDAACELVVAHLSRAVPMGLWAVTRVADDRQTMLAVDSPGYPSVEVGVELPFRTSLCSQMANGQAPAVAPDIAVEDSYTAAAGCAEHLGFQVGAYAGARILGPSGTLFGTLCGYNPTATPGLSEATQPLLSVFAGLLSVVLTADLALTERNREAERAWSFAESDELTGLLNRRGWGRLLALEDARFRRFGDPATVIVIDVDDFKTVNDTHGHHVGDRMLQAVAHQLRRTARATDIVARLGGDEFGIIAVGAGRAEAATLVRRLQHALIDTGLQISTGSAPHTAGGGLTTAWEQADAAMYAARRRRRDGGDRAAQV